MSELNSQSTKTERVVGTPILLIKTLLIMAAFASAPVFAKTCRNVHLEVKNQTGKSIKIIDLDYWDSETEKWRSEPVRNEVIKKGLTWQENRNLEHVHNQKVKVRVEYRVHAWNKTFKRWNWAAKKSRSYSVSKKCTKNSDFTITVR